MHRFLSQPVAVPELWRLMALCCASDSTSPVGPKAHGP